MAGGRPTKYTKKMKAKAETYLDVWEDLGHIIPSQHRLCEFLGVVYSTTQKWDKDEDKPEFSVILRKINTAQRNILIDRGLIGKFNPAIAKLVLGKHGFHDKVDETSKRDITIHNVDKTIE